VKSQVREELEDLGSLDPEGRRGTEGVARNLARVRGSTTTKQKRGPENASARGNKGGRKVKKQTPGGVGGEGSGEG
jgi:hypothetical protein